MTCKFPFARRQLWDECIHLLRHEEATLSRRQQSYYSNSSPFSFYLASSSRINPSSEAGSPIVAAGTVSLAASGLPAQRCALCGGTLSTGARRTELSGFSPSSVQLKDSVTESGAVPKFASTVRAECPLRRYLRRNTYNHYETFVCIITYR